MGAHVTDRDTLTPFVELAVRVPLTDLFHIDEGFTHEEVLRYVLEEGLGTFIWDELDSPNTRSVLRLRWGGVDRVYPLVHKGNGMVVREHPQGA